MRQNAPYSHFIPNPKESCDVGGQVISLGWPCYKNHMLYFLLYRIHIVLIKYCWFPLADSAGKLFLAKLLVWVKVILHKTGHNCFGLLSWMLSTGNIASLSQNLAFCEGRTSWPKVKNSVNARGIWPGSSMSQLLYSWPCSKENGKIRKSKQMRVLQDLHAPKYSLLHQPSPPAVVLGPLRSSSSAGSGSSHSPCSWVDRIEFLERL